MKEKLTRRDFLTLAAFSAVGAAVSACNTKPSAVKETPLGVDIPRPKAPEIPGLTLVEREGIDNGYRPEGSSLRQRFFYLNKEGKEVGEFCPGVGVKIRRFSARQTCGETLSPLVPYIPGEIKEAGNEIRHGIVALDPQEVEGRLSSAQWAVVPVVLGRRGGLSPRKMEIGEMDIWTPNTIIFRDPPTLISIAGLEPGDAIVSPTLGNPEGEVKIRYRWQHNRRYVKEYSIRVLENWPNRGSGLESMSIFINNDLEKKDELPRPLGRVNFAEPIFRKYLPSDPVNLLDVTNHLSDPVLVAGIRRCSCPSLEDHLYSFGVSNLLQYDGHFVLLREAVTPKRK